MRPRSLRPLLLWILLLGAGAAAAQVSAPRPGPPGPDGKPTLMLDFEDVDITDVIKVIAELTGKNFLYDERVRGRMHGIDEHERPDGTRPLDGAMHVVDRELDPVDLAITRTNLGGRGDPVARPARQNRSDDQIGLFDPV